MKMLFRITFVVIGLLIALAFDAFAQTGNKVIPLPAGKTSIVEKAVIPGDAGVDYTFTVAKGSTVKFFVGGLYSDGSEGQGLLISLAKADKKKKPLVEAAPGEEIVYPVKSAGEYVIIVNNPGDQKAKTTLQLEIVP
jgi:hypothetical protein